MLESADLDVTVGDFAVQILDATPIFLGDFAELTQLRVFFYEHVFEAYGLRIVVTVAGPVFGVTTRHDGGLPGIVDNVCEGVILGLGDFVAGELVSAAGDVGGAGLARGVRDVRALVTDMLGRGFVGRPGAVGVLVNGMLERGFVLDWGGFYGQRFPRVRDGGRTTILGIKERLAGLVKLRVAGVGVRWEARAEHQSAANCVRVAGGLNAQIWN